MIDMILDFHMPRFMNSDDNRIDPVAQIGKLFFIDFWISDCCRRQCSPANVLYACIEPCFSQDSGKPPLHKWESPSIEVLLLNPVDFAILWCPVEEFLHLLLREREELLDCEQRSLHWIFGIYECFNIVDILASTENDNLRLLDFLRVGVPNNRLEFSIGAQIFEAGKAWVMSQNYGNKKSYASLGQR